ncbi:MAG TPA: hypothetical protein PLV25_06270, partial [Opitutales bacterium]|nr:hypothetical protein [Opitutales bacterium]
PNTGAQLDPTNPVFLQTLFRRALQLADPNRQELNETLPFATEHLSEAQQVLIQHALRYAVHRNKIRTLLLLVKLGATFSKETLRHIYEYADLINQLEWVGQMGRINRIQRNSPVISEAERVLAYWTESRTNWAWHTELRMTPEEVIALEAAREGLAGTQVEVNINMLNTLADTGMTERTLDQLITNYPDDILHWINAVARTPAEANNQLRIQEALRAIEMINSLPKIKLAESDDTDRNIHSSSPAPHDLPALKEKLQSILDKAPTPARLDPQEIEQRFEHLGHNVRHLLSQAAQDAPLMLTTIQAGLAGDYLRAFQGATALVTHVASNSAVTLDAVHDVQVLGAGVQQAAGQPGYTAAFINAFLGCFKSMLGWGVPSTIAVVKTEEYKAPATSNQDDSHAKSE